MKRVTTKVTKKTPSVSSITQTVTTTKIPNPRGGQQSGLRQPGYGQASAQQQQPRNIKTVASKNSNSSITGTGQRQTRTEETVTTRVQMPIAQAASNWQSGLRTAGPTTRPMTYSQMLQQRRLVEQQKAEAKAQEKAQAQAQAEWEARRSCIPKLQVPKAVPWDIAKLAKQQYAELMTPEPPPMPRKGQRQQVPVYGGRQLQMPGGQQGQQQRRQMQQPQVTCPGARSSQMQQPGYQSKMQPPRKAGTAQPTRKAQPRQGPRSPETTEYEMIERFSPRTMREFEMMEQPETPRPPPQQQRRLPQPQYTSTVEEEYQTIRSPERQGPYGAAAQPPQPRRTMRQPGFAGGLPQQVASVAEDQYAALMDTPSPPRRSPPQQRQSPCPPSSPCHQKTPTDKAADITIPTAASGQPTDLELQLEEALFNTSRTKPDTPFRAEGTIQRRATPQESPDTSMAFVQTPDGPMPAETQLLIEGVVKRTPTEEIVTRHVVAVEGGIVDERETIQMTPGKGIRRPKTPESTELIVCSSEVKMAGGYRETTTKVVYETTDDPPSSPQSPKLPSSVTPHIVSQLVLEESQDVDKTSKLHAPDLKHSSPLTYGIKKRVNALQLNMMEVSELEQSVSWPPARPDQAQEDPQPELLATMMHTEESGLAMGGTPDHLYTVLFGTSEPVKADEGTVEVNSVVAHPLNDVVVPAAPANRDLHIMAMTPELVDVAVSAQNNESDIRPSDAAYCERVLGDKKDTASIKVKNVAHKDGPPVKYPVFFDADHASPLEVDKFDAVIKQVGAIPTHILEASVVGPASSGAAEELRDFAADGIEYLLNMDKVMHQSNVQLRGSQTPSWFPGYYMALGGPYGSEAVTIVRSPSKVLATAYKAVQPEVFPDDSIVVV